LRAPQDDVRVRPVHRFAVLEIQNAFCTPLGVDVQANDGTLVCGPDTVIDGRAEGAFGDLANDLCNGGAVGTFRLSPANGAVAAGESVPLALTWTHPGTWRDLETLQLRLRDEQGTVLWVRFDEASGTLRLVDPRTNRLGHPVAVGGNGVLGGPTAMVLPRDSSVVAAGPTDPTVTVTFSVRLKQKAAGRTFLVEVLATDDVGRRQGFDLAGRLTVSR
jgi:hypothetical protein